MLGLSVAWALGTWQPRAEEEQVCAEGGWLAGHPVTCVLSMGKGHLLCLQACQHCHKILGIRRCFKMYHIISLARGKAWHGWPLSLSRHGS